MKRTQAIELPEKEIAKQKEWMAEFAALEDRPHTYCVVTYGCQMNAHDSEKLEGMLAPLKAAQPEVYAAVLGAGLKDTGIGSTIFALKPGDGSAREQAASCQKVLGGWANVAAEYATKRYRSNLINWGMLPLLADAALAQKLSVGDCFVLPGIRTAVEQDAAGITGWLVSASGAVEAVELRLGDLTADERQIILDGCLINFYNHN